MVVSFIDFLNEKVIKNTKVGDMNASERMAHTQTKAEGDNWIKSHPIHHSNIVHHWDNATHFERHDGMHWYADAQHFNRVLAHDVGVSTHTMAGLTANYSPQTDWHTNMLNAARVAKHHKGIGGPGQVPYKGQKMFAGNDQKKNADRMLAGESHETVLKGLKIRHFAHLVEHGGNADNTKPHVAIDRHAISIASGARITDAAFGIIGAGKSKKKYGDIHKAYVDAASHINKKKRR